MTRSEELASYLLTHQKNLNLEGFSNWAKEVGHPVRIKLSGSKGKILINLNKDMGWTTPQEWLYDYQRKHIRLLMSERECLLKCLPQAEFQKVLASTNVDEVNSQLEGISYQGEGKAEGEASEKLECLASVISRQTQIIINSLNDNQQVKLWDVVRNILHFTDEVCDTQLSHKLNQAVREFNKRKSGK